MHQEEYIYQFNPEKNALLIRERSVSFEEIIAALEEHGPLDVLEHPNTSKYAHQKLYVVELRGYAYLVPFVEQGNIIFLKTIFPNREATKKYLTGEEL